MILKFLKNLKIVKSIELNKTMKDHFDPVALEKIKTAATIIARNSGGVAAVRYINELKAVPLHITLPFVNELVANDLYPEDFGSVCADCLGAKFDSAAADNARCTICQRCTRCNDPSLLNYYADMSLPIEATLLPLIRDKDYKQLSEPAFNYQDVDIAIIKYYFLNAFPDLNIEIEHCDFVHSYRAMAAYLSNINATIKHQCDAELKLKEEQIFQLMLEGLLDVTEQARTLSHLELVERLMLLQSKWYLYSSAKTSLSSWSIGKGIILLDQVTCAIREIHQAEMRA